MVPVIQDEDGTVVYESAIINEYLNEKYPNIPLMPDTPADRARARIWVDFCNSYFTPPISKIVWGTDDKKQEHLKIFRENLSILNRELEGREFIAGRFSLVDIAYIPFFNRIQANEELAPLCIDKRAVPDLVAWVERLMKRESYNKTKVDAETYRAHVAKRRAQLAAAA
jgi:glutathione S-transferase